MAHRAILDSMFAGEGFLSEEIGSMAILTTDDFERRQMTRINAAFCERQHVLLRVRGKEVAAELVDQSSTGFSVMIPKGRVRIGQRLLLGTRATWHEVEVIHVEKQGKELRVGLQTIEDCVEPRDKSYMVWAGLFAILFLVSLVVYLREDPNSGLIHQFLSFYGVAFE